MACLNGTIQHTEWREVILSKILSKVCHNHKIKQPKPGANDYIWLKSLQKVGVFDLFSVLWVVGFQISTLPMKHLGFLLELLTNLVESGMGLFRKWKKIYLSKGDRLTLIKSTLSSLPTYFLSLCLFFHYQSELLTSYERFWGVLMENTNSTRLIGLQWVSQHNEGA